MKVPLLLFTAMILLCLQVVSQMAAKTFPWGSGEALNPADHSLDMSVEVTVGVTPADADRAPRAAPFATTALPDGRQELTAEVDVELSPDAIGEQGGSAACSAPWPSLPVIRTVNPGRAAAAGTDRRAKGFVQQLLPPAHFCSSRRACWLSLP